MSGKPIAPTFKDKKRGHLRKTDEISSVFDFKCRMSSSHFFILGKPNNRSYPRIAIMVAKKTSRFAVRRNYMRRVMREFFRKNKLDIAPLDIVVGITKPFVKQDADEINQEITMIFTKLVKCRAP